jgi:hypothetical protein
MTVHKPSTRAPILFASIASFVTLIFYLGIVAITTPQFPPLISMQIAFSLNGPIFLAFSTGIGIQTFLVTYSRRLPCSIANKKTATGATGISASLSAFFSFFSLVHVGCCGLWLYILSLLPGFLGVGVSGFLIQYSNILALVGLLGVAISIFLMYRNVRSKLKLISNSIAFNSVNTCKL